MRAIFNGAALVLDQHRPHVPEIWLDQPRPCQTMRRPARGSPRMIARIIGTALLFLPALAASNSYAQQPGSIGETGQQPSQQPSSISGKTHEREPEIPSNRKAQQPAPTHVPSAAHNRGEPTRTKEHQPRKENVSLAAYDGAWVGSSFGQCIVNGWSWNVEIRGGNISGKSVSGRVSGGGRVSGEMNVFGATYDFKGHLSLGQGSGTWLVPSGAKAGCTGTWTIVKS